MENSDSHSEHKLLLRIARGEQRAFSQLVAQYAPLIHTHLTMYMKDAKKAEEITQDVLMEKYY